MILFIYQQAENAEDARIDKHHPRFLLGFGAVPLHHKRKQHDYAELRKLRGLIIHDAEVYPALKLLLARDYLGVDEHINEKYQRHKPYQAAEAAEKIDLEARHQQHHDYAYRSEFKLIYKVIIRVIICIRSVAGGNVACGEHHDNADRDQIYHKRKERKVKAAGGEEFPDLAGEQALEPSFYIKEALELAPKESQLALEADALEFRCGRLFRHDPLPFLMHIFII